MKKQTVVTGIAVAAILALIVEAAYAAIVGSTKEGLVEYVGSQKDVFVSGKASSVVSRLVGTNEVAGCSPSQYSEGLCGLAAVRQSPGAGSRN